MLRIKRFIRRYWRASLRLAFLLLTLLTLILAVMWYQDPHGEKYEPAITIFGILASLIGSFTLYDWLANRKSSPSSLSARGSAIAPNTVIHDTALRVLSRAVEDGGLAGLKRLLDETETLRAIESTAHAFPFIPNVDQALERWCQSNGLADLLADIARGRVQHPDAALVESFISDGKFSKSISDPTKDAEQILETFYRHLFEEGLKGSNGPLEQYLRAEERHDEMRGRFDRVDAIFDEQAKTVSAAAHAMPSVFLKAGDFFRRYLKRQRVFHHAWRTVGRADAVRVLDEFVKSADLEIAIMPGRGGIGKTKIIQTWSNSNSGVFGMRYRPLQSQ